MPGKAGGRLPRKAATPSRKSSGLEAFVHFALGGFCGFVKGLGESGVDLAAHDGERAGAYAAGELLSVLGYFPGRRFQAGR